ncbi:arginine/serine-rich protein 1 isoform X2 [Notamacropus eugenii]|uniref:arginine/serine-rich protein 1 isoform X2 n=1 Tax=Notamacropus eugenii TaxID=9315 RepID=UPI003B67F26D
MGLRVPQFPHLSERADTSGTCLTGWSPGSSEAPGAPPLPPWHARHLPAPALSSGADLAAVTRSVSGAPPQFPCNSSALKKPPQASLKPTNNYVPGLEPGCGSCETRMRIPTECLREAGVGLAGPSPACCHCACASREASGTFGGYWGLELSEGGGNGLVRKVTLLRRFSVGKRDDRGPLFSHTALGVCFERAMTSYVNDMWPGSPQGKDSPSGSGTGLSSRLSSRSSSASSSVSSRSASSPSSRSSSRSRSRSQQSRSRSQSRRRHQRKYRRYSRSYSRSRSRSRSYRHWERPPPRAYQRYYRSPSRGRSRSRSRSHRRSYYQGAYLGSRRRRYYGFGRTVYPEAHKRWRYRSRSRSRSHTPLRLSEKDRMELLEIAKANAAKALGTANIDLPPSLRTGPQSKDTNCGKRIQGDAAKLVEMFER